MRYRTNSDYQNESHHLRNVNRVLREVIVELAAALIRADKNGYQAKTIDACLTRAIVARETVDAFNVERAERIAQWKANQ